MAQKAKVWNKPLYDAYKFHYGFSFKAGTLNFSVKPSEYFKTNDTIKSVTGNGKAIFGANMVGNMKLNNYFDLRFIPGMQFGQREMVYEEKLNTGNYVKTKMQIETTLLEFPVLIKYRSTRENNYRPYIIAGVNYAIDLAAMKKQKEGEFIIKLNRQDILLEAGFGVDYYLPFFKFGTEIKFSYGLLNIVNYDSYQEPVNKKYLDVFEKLGTKMLTLAIYFE